MKFLFSFIFLLLGLFAFDLKAQDKTTNDEVFVNVDVMPEFPGGMDDLSYFIYTHIKYPDDAIKAGIEGRVIVSFIIDETGKVKNVKTLKGVHPLLDKEAERVVSLMPNWIPGKHNGKNVKVQFNLPVTFSLVGQQ
jgi:protein TonB